MLEIFAIFEIFEIFGNHIEYKWNGIKRAYPISVFITNQRNERG